MAFVTGHGTKLWLFIQNLRNYRVLYVHTEGEQLPTYDKVAVRKSVKEQGRDDKYDVIYRTE